MDKETINLAIRQLKELAGDDGEIVVTKVIDDEKNQGALLLFDDSDDEVLVESAAYIYDDGTLFHLYDWQGGRPGTLEEIVDFDWLSASGHHATVLNGAPRLLVG